MEYSIVWIMIVIGIVAIYFSKKILFHQVKEACLLILLDHPRFLDELKEEIIRRSKGTEKYHEKVIIAALEELIREDYVSKSLKRHPKKGSDEWLYKFKAKPPRRNRYSELSMFRKKVSSSFYASARAP